MFAVPVGQKSVRIIYHTWYLVYDLTLQSRTTCCMSHHVCRILVQGISNPDTRYPIAPFPRSRSPSTLVRSNVATLRFLVVGILRECLPTLSCLLLICVYLRVVAVVPCHARFSCARPARTTTTAVAWLGTWLSWYQVLRTRYRHSSRYEPRAAA